MNCDRRTPTFRPHTHRVRDFHAVDRILRRVERRHFSMKHCMRTSRHNRRYGVRLLDRRLVQSVLALVERRSVDDAVADRVTMPLRQSISNITSIAYTKPSTTSKLVVPCRYLCVDWVHRSRNAFSNIGGSFFPRFSALRSIPAHATSLKEYFARCPPVFSKICHNEDSLASLGDTEVLSIENAPRAVVPFGVRGTQKPTA